jgi:hypothetical protein
MTLLPKERERTTIVREGEPAILNFEPIKNLAVALRWFQSGRAPQEAARARPRHLPLNSHNGGAVLLIFVAFCPEFGACNQSHSKRNRVSVLGVPIANFFSTGEGQERAIRSGRKFGVFRNFSPPRRGYQASLLAAAAKPNTPRALDRPTHDRSPSFYRRRYDLCFGGSVPVIARYHAASDCTRALAAARSDCPR